jgi:hypothetical protein
MQELQRGSDGDDSIMGIGTPGFISPEEMLGEAVTVQVIVPPGQLPFVGSLMYSLLLRCLC